MLTAISIADAAPQPAAQKFLPLNRQQAQPKAPQTQHRYIPLQRQGGRPLIFVPSAVHKQKKKQAPDHSESTPLSQEQARQILSIYEPVK